MRAPGPALVATGWSLHLPGIDVAGTIGRHVGVARGAWASAASVPADRAGTLLGRKGLLYKEPATRLALCAVHRALRLPPGRRPDRALAPRTAVVACSNLGNVGTVAQVTRQVAAEGGRTVSVLDAPNVSPNVVASTVALWFGFGGPNVMLCSGAAAGYDGVAAARLLLRSGRADRVVLVGAEPADPVATDLHAADPHAPARLLAGAACVVLRLRPAGAPADPRHAVVDLPSGDWPRPPRLVLGPDGFDPTAHWGDPYGARGVAWVALAAHLAVDEWHRVVAISDPAEDRRHRVLVGAT